MAHINPASLTPAQLDGTACVICSDEDGAMIPVDVIEGGQVFAHRSCVNEPAPSAAPVVLVVGNTSTADHLADLTAFACDVADRLRFPTVVATGRDYDPTEFEAVVLADGWSETFESAALGCEATLADMCTLWADDVYEYPVNTMCGHCYETDPEAAPVRSEDGWTVSVCPSCVTTARREALPGVLVAA